jgi:DNA-binding CsgD family transcriptional regulator
VSIPRYGQPLGRRELEILQLTSQGFSYGEAARQIQPAVSENTAKAHMQHAMTKLGARSAAQAVLLACHAGYIDGRPQRHGDHPGYEAHIRRGDKICDPCRDGEKAYRAALKARQKA